jgi:hypothetical protein
MTLPIDPHADISQRAWLRCPRCRHSVGCPECDNGHNCGTHWQYLLSNNGPLLFLQCPACTELWEFDALTLRRLGKRDPKSFVRLQQGTKFAAAHEQENQ